MYSIFTHQRMGRVKMEKEMVQLLFVCEQANQTQHRWFNKTQGKCSELFMRSSETENLVFPHCPIGLCAPRKGLMLFLYEAFEIT